MNIEDIPGNHDFELILDKLQNTQWTTNIKCKLCQLQLFISNECVAIFPKGTKISSHYSFNDFYKKLNRLTRCEDQMIKNILE